jgi:accessory colonization factor AcfC
MKRPLEIVLSQNYLWDDSDYSYVWPYCLAKANPTRIYSFEDLKKEVFGMVVKGASKANRSRDVRGIEVVNSNRVYVHGISLFEKESGGYRMTPEAEEIANAYIKDEKSDHWKILVIQQVLKYDIRVRIQHNSNPQLADKTNERRFGSILV